MGGSGVSGRGGGVIGGGVDSLSCSWVRVRIIDLGWNTNAPSQPRQGYLHARTQAPTQENHYHEPEENEPPDGLTTERGHWRISAIRDFRRVP